MKLYKIEPEDFDYDEYIEVAVIAESKERALEMTDCFKEHQHPLTVTEVDMATEQTVIASYMNA